VVERGDPVRRVAPEERHPAAVSPDEPEQHAQCRRLAGAVRPQVAVDVAGLDRQVDVVDSVNRPVRLHETANLNRNLRHQHDATPAT
jgi:hypothetical protein